MQTSEAVTGGIPRVTRAAWAQPVAMALMVAALVLLLGNYTKVVIDNAVYWHVADDHMITQRVAWTFWTTGAPHFNVGEAVAANTSLFWPMALAPIYAVFGHAAAIPAVILLSALIWGATVVIAVGLIRAPALRWPVALVLALLPTALRYAPTGWEHLPQALAMTAAFAAILRASGRAGRLSVPWPAPALLALAFLARMDTAVTILVVVAAYLMTDGKWRRPGPYAFLAALLAAPAGYLAGMLHFYGDVVPNTAHLKVLELGERVSLGWAYVSDPRASGPVPVLLLLLLGLLAAGRARPGAGLIAGAAAAHLAYVWAMGGDVFPLGRFLIVYLPILLVLVVDFRPVTRPMLLGAALAALLVTGHVPILTDEPGRTARYGAHPEHAGMIRTMHVAQERLTPGDGSIGLHHLGIAYHVPEFHVVDFLGKAEPVIARSAPKWGPIGHNKWDYDHALSAHDVAAVPIFAPVVATVGAPGYARAERDQSFWEIASRALLARGYVFVPPERFGNPADGWGLFVRGDLAGRFEG